MRDPTGPDSPDEHELAQSLLTRYARTRGFRLGLPAAFQLDPATRAVLFLRSGPRDLRRDLFELDLTAGTERRVIGAAELLGGQDERLPPAEAARRERMRLVAGGIASFELAPDSRSVLIPLSGSLFVVDRATGAHREIGHLDAAPHDTGDAVPAPAPIIDPRLSPDGARVAAVRDGDLHVIDVASGRARRLTWSAGAVTCGLAEYVAQEEMKRLRGHWWSPDGARLAYQRTDESAVEVLRVLDPMWPERPVDERRYPRAGRANADVRLGVVSAGGGDTTWIDWDRARYPYLVTVRWQAHAPLTVVVQTRDQTELAVLAADPDTGAIRALHVERDDAWINIDPAVPLWLPDGAAWLWTTERRGAWQLELRDRDGGLIRAVTEPALGLQGVCGVDAGRGVAYVVASPDPTCAHVWRVPLDPDGPSGPAAGAPERLTEGAGVHAAVVAADGSAVVHMASPLAGRERVTVRDADNRHLADIRSAAEAPPMPIAPAPPVELTVARVEPAGASGGDSDGRELHAALIRPRDFVPGRRYPVIVHVYGGPHVCVVTAQATRYLLDQWLADQGFVVVLADGRGTPHRGRAWERAIRGDLASCALADQVAALRALAARYPELDLDRVGVFGWSFGGYLAAMAAMRRPDVFRAAVAGAPVTDWRDYDTHYTERYLGLPGDDPGAYDRSSLLSYADRLTRPLLIVHGTVDDNVYFLHSLKLSDALFRAGAPHQLLPLSGFTHMVPGALETERLHGRIAAFFAGHLGAGPV